MNNTRRFIGEISVTLVVAFALSALVVLAMTMVAGGTGNYEKLFGIINAAGGVVFGGIFGYKLNSLVRTHKK